MAAQQKALLAPVPGAVDRFWLAQNDRMIGVKTSPAWWCFTTPSRNACDCQPSNHLVIQLGNPNYNQSLNNQVGNGCITEQPVTQKYWLLMTGNMSIKLQPVISNDQPSGGKDSVDPLTSSFQCHEFPWPAMSTRHHSPANHQSIVVWFQSPVATLPTWVKIN